MLIPALQQRKINLLLLGPEGQRDLRPETRPPDHY
jgi:hypothetical protein